jgi:hypothetical protein
MISNDGHSNGRLDAWKEIAAYLNRDVRTVIRWERKGLPVHRVPGGKRQAVFAYRDEIDGWLGSDHSERTGVENLGKPRWTESQTELKKPSQALDGVAVEALSSRNQNLLAFGRKIVFLSTVLITVFLVAAAVLTRSSTSASVSPMSLRQLTDDNRYKTNLRTDGRNLFFNEFEVNREILVFAPVSGGPIRQIKTPFANVELQDISSDGQSILVTSFAGSEPSRPLWIISTDGTKPPRRVGDLRCRTARWSPGRDRIACANGTSLILLEHDGSDPQTVSPLGGVVTRLVWSPEGNRLRFVLQDVRTRDFTAWEMALNDKNSRRTTEQLDWGRNCCIDWAWTGGGKRFLYLKYESKPVLRMHTEAGHSRGGESVVPLDIGYTAWLADGSDPESTYLLVQNTLQNEVLKFDPGRKTFQTALPSLSATLLAFSRDGQWMTYTDAGNSLWRSRADGSDAIQITKPPMEVEFSSWSPDGTRIAFMGREPGREWRIYVSGRDGGELREAAPGDDAQGAPTWSADGRKLAYANVDCLETDTCWVRILDLATGAVEKLPGSHGFRTARWSPDGRYIAAFIPSTYQLMLFNVRQEKWTLLANSVTGDNLAWSHDSRFVFADSPRGERPIIERFRINDGKRSAVVSLESLEEAPGQIDFWFGLAPGDAPLIVHRFTSSEAYELSWAH